MLKGMKRSRPQTPAARPLVEITGWYGAIAILAAYFLVSFEYLSTQDIYYHLLNGSGAIGLGWEAFVKKDYQPTVLNLVFFGIAVYALIRIVTA
jgi:hypothetical protein